MLCHKEEQKRQTDNDEGQVQSRPSHPISTVARCVRHQKPQRRAQRGWTHNGRCYGGINLQLSSTQVAPISAEEGSPCDTKLWYNLFRILLDKGLRTLRLPARRGPELAGSRHMVPSLQRASDRFRVLIVTGNNMSAEMLKSVLERGQKEFTVETLIGSSQKAIGKLEKPKADVIVICEDLEDGAHAGFRVLKSLRDSHQRCAAIMLLECRNGDCAIEAFRHGACGIFYRTNPVKALSKCIRVVHQGQIWAGNEDIKDILNVLSHLNQFQLKNADGMPLLTRREEEVVRLVADGLKNREIAQKLNLKEHSVRNYLYRIFEKLGVSTRVELILYAVNQWEKSN